MACSTLYKFNSGSELPEWSAELEFTENYLGKKIHSRIKVSAELETGSAFSVYYALDGGAYKLAGTFDYFTGYRTIQVDITPERCDRFRIKFAGTGYVKIYELSREMEFGSTVMANRGEVMRWDLLDALKWDGADTLTWNKINKFELPE